MTSLPNDPYPFFYNYDEWFEKDTKGKESNCNWNALRYLIQNITINEDHFKTCVTTQYLGNITLDRDNSQIDNMNDNDTDARFIYKFTLPLKAKVYEEYLFTDGITLIGSIRGTLGIFIGFSVNNVVYTIINFLKSTIEIHFSRK